MLAEHRKSGEFVQLTELRTLDTIFPVLWMKDRKFFVSESSFYNITGVRVPKRIAYIVNNKTRLYESEFLYDLMYRPKLPPIYANLRREIESRLDGLIRKAISEPYD